MSKTSGMGARFFVAGVDLSGDVGSLQSIASPVSLQDATGVDKEAMERIKLLRDGTMSFTAFWNPTGAHPVLAELPTADRPVMYAHRSATGAPAAAIVAKQIGYDPTRNADGSLTATVEAQANGYGLEWGQLLTAGVAETTSAGAQDGHDYGATVGTTAFGLQAYLHVFAFTGTDATIAIQDSDDDGTGDAYADVTGATFALVDAAPGSQRLQTDRDQAVKRWLRVNVSGTFSQLDFAVAVVKNQGLVIF